MADKKITALNLINEVDINAGDLLHIVDRSHQELQSIRK